MRNTIKNFVLGIAAVGALSLTACMSSGSSSVGPGADEFGTVVVQTRTGDVNNLSKPGLAKSSVITLDSLIITAISNATTPDTVVVRLTVGDSGFVDTSTIDQNIGVVLNLKALRTWYISAVTKDVNDSTIHTGADTVESLLAGQVRTVNLSASPEFSMYKATFNFPDSIYSPTGLFGQRLLISKIKLNIDGEDVAVGTGSDTTDTIFAGTDTITGFYLADTSYILTYDYVANAADSVTMTVYGYLPTSDSTWSDVENVLYDTTRAIADLSTSSVNNVALGWKGPVDGAADLTVEIGKVGTYEVEGETPDVVLD